MNISLTGRQGDKCAADFRNVLDKKACGNDFFGDNDNVGYVIVYLLLMIFSGQALVVLLALRIRF